MDNQTIASLQKELDELGDTTTALTAENLADSGAKDNAESRFEDNTGESELNKPLNEAKESPKIQPQEDIKKDPHPLKEEDNSAKKYYQERAEKRANRIQNLEAKFNGVEATLNKLVSLLDKGKTEEAQDKFEQ